MSSEQTNVPRIQLLATGSTIASRFAAATQDVRVQASGSELTSGIAGRLVGIDVVVEDVLNIASFEMDLAPLALDSSVAVVVRS